MDYIQNTDQDVSEMLRSIGKKDIDELFDSIPQNIKLSKNVDLPQALCEVELFSHIKSISTRNTASGDIISFLGGGYYNHYIPAVVDELSSRSEFYTAYTPYQAEASQGNLQATFEYQTMICELTGLDVSNASHYDGATALTEAMAMALDHTGRNTILISSAVNPEYRKVAKTYFSNLDVEIKEIPSENGITRQDFDASQAACVAIQNPNFFGCIEDLEAFANTAHKSNALAIASVEPISLALLKSPGEVGFDIATGEGQSAGIYSYYGGPGLGFMATKKEFMRAMPGRIVGETQDIDGKRAFVLTLQTREQHIRREKASSNICTNQALMALRAAIYFSTLGRVGLRNVAELCINKAHYLAENICKVKGVERTFNAPFFNEFAITLPIAPAQVIESLSKNGIFAGIEVGKFYSDLKNSLLIAVTEKTSKADMDKFIASLQQIIK
ncbi:aminomethyl-transferring glycine dehydrogenase subunit GcvPA [Candidatus Peregrinibacteria bacterium]|nr:aminomethyl-transferring glycine dehydrogenase subunit GcvPA [Candidatus Peregrinibacteria bacterium]